MAMVRRVSAARYGGTAIALPSGMTESSDSPEVRHEPDQSRFAAHMGDDIATARYERSGDTLILSSTHVPPDAEGEGVASALARAALEFAREQGLRVHPACSFMRSYIERNPEYQELLDR
jgi:uncharacterized protein